MEQATLYLGSNIGNVYGVTERKFKKWLDDIVTPQFSGFTISETSGYWKGKREFSRKLEIVGSGLDFKEKIVALGEDYKTRFLQDAVMITFENVGVAWDVPNVDNKRFDVV